MEDDLNNFENGREPQFFFHMADDLNILLNKMTSIFFFKFKKGGEIMQLKTSKS
jgi:hypothetical protein